MPPDFRRPSGGKRLQTGQPLKKSWRREYAVSGYPAFFLCVIPMIVGYIVIVKATIEAIF